MQEPVVVTSFLPEECKKAAHSLTCVKQKPSPNLTPLIYQFSGSLTPAFFQASIAKVAS